MKRLLLLALLVLCLFPAPAVAQAPLLDRDPGGVTRIFVLVRPVWSLAEQARTQGQAGTVLYSRHLERYAMWADPPGQHGALIAALHDLTTSGYVDWNPQTGFAVPVGRVGLVVPRAEIMLWYADGSLRLVLLGQPETLDGRRFAFLFDNFNFDGGGALHPMNLYVLDAASAAAVDRQLSREE